MKPEQQEITITTYIAAVLYLVLSVLIWFPIGMLMSLVNPTLTVIIFVTYFIKEVARIYLGVKV